MENLGSDARAAVQRAGWESWAPLFPSAGRGTHRSTSASLEREEVHRLLDSDSTARPTRQQFLQDPTEDRLKIRRLESGGAHDAGGGYSAHLRAEYLQQMGGGLTGAQG